MGLDIYFQKHKNSTIKTERALEEFYSEFNERMLVSEVRALAEKYGVADRIDIEEHSYTDATSGTHTYVTAYRNDSEEVGYMRKHNHLLPYFGYEDNCSNLPVSREALEAFIDDAKEVLSHKGKDDFEEVASDLIPTEEGFFFGSTDYDDWFCDELEEDINIFQNILDGFDFNKDTLVMHCWW